MAFRLATVTNDKLSSVINRVSFPSFSAMQEDGKNLVEHWFSLTRKIGFLTFPLLAVLAVNAHDFIAVVLGSRWISAAPMVKFLCVMSALKSLSAVTVNLACARGRTDIAFRFSLVNALALPVAFLIACKLGSAIGVAVAWCVAFPLLCWYLLVQVSRLVDVRVLDYCRHLLTPLLLAATCCLCMIPMGWVLPEGIIRLILRSGAGLAVFVAYLLSRPGARESLNSALGLARRRNVEATPAVATTQG
jgi:O-antigen/teichoic acid export membrane protein